ncbi:MAG TPA: hypothetical protein VM011_10560 [Gammaproteobacteria bacterium]|nr:hypothetical protein [Gammaproteobacteria bacterium]
MEPLKLSLPVQHGYTDPTVETDVVRLRAWLDDLPLLDVVETLRLVRGGLDGLNEQKHAAEARLVLLEAYRVTTQRLFHTLDPLQLGQLNLTRVRRKEAIDGIGRLLMSQANGYKLVVVDLYAGSGKGKPHPQLGHVLHRALQQMTWVLMDGFRFYRAAQPSLIAETHQLYHLARRFGLLGVVVQDDTGATTSAGYYHAGMLLALTDPARLEEGEASLLFDVLLRHADKCRIVPGNSWEGTGEGLFLVDLHADALPVPCTRLDSPASLQDAYLLDANPALQAIRAQLAKTPAGVRMQSPEAMVLRRLLPEDLSADRRREPRHGDGRYISLLNGLGQIHAYLLRAAGRVTAGSKPAKPELVECHVIDSSTSGMKLSWEQGGAGDARVGDLLGLLESQGDQQLLRLAIVRAIRVHPQGGMETGVQLLASSVGAVFCTLPDQPETGALPALFMPAIEEERVNATLLAAKGIYEFGRQLSIDVGGREISVRAGRRVYDSPVFDRFEFAAQ